MPFAIQDEFSARTDISRQYRYQLRKARDGRCIICGREAVTRHFCEAHRRITNVRSREAMRIRNGWRTRHTQSESYQFDLAK